MYSSKSRFAVAAELMSSGRTYAFNVSALEPAWLAEANPHAARLWQVLPRGQNNQEGGKRASVDHPPFIELAGVRLPVAGHGRRPTVDIPLHAVPELLRVSLKSLPPQTKRWRARVITPYGVLARGGLHETLAVLPHLPWPAADATHDTRAPLGALLEPDRNLHTMMRYFDELCSPMLGPKVAQTGWLALVSNGGGGFWYDVLPDYPDALDATLEAVEHLLAAADETGDITGKLIALAQKLEDIGQRLEAAMHAATR
jgi:hypothetical protein